MKNTNIHPSSPDSLRFPESHTFEPLLHYAITSNNHHQSQVVGSHLGIAITMICLNYLGNQTNFLTVFK
ncbi:omega-6 fatty acid desaturase (Delta-12 desaturase) [Puccinia sorghi]|uniref:Omega-6 fatty acid desaturase (Delta-12 desaturase) n=1 Tax=Puccinia sorghi TaxID=27349 RepID=A0A0L6VI62_9BASI|nr:omega-6 fatty acid desaturase (Delta-12 desaturase) [Puccinia sorghi]